jgi:dTMP kinase
MELMIIEVKTFEKLKETENIIVIDGNNSIEDISAEIWDKVAHFYK